MRLNPTLKIAFCDDDEDEHLILRETLKDAGYPDTMCDCKLNGNDLLDSLCSGILPDVILLDIYMPVMGALETLEKIRRDAKFQNVPVLLVADSPEYLEEMFKQYPHLTVDGILTKPITVDSLVNLLKPYRHCF